MMIPKIEASVILGFAKACKDVNGIFITPDDATVLKFSEKIIEECASHEHLDYLMIDTVISVAKSHGGYVEEDWSKNPNPVAAMLKNSSAEVFYNRLAGCICNHIKNANQ